MKNQKRVLELLTNQSKYLSLQEIATNLAITPKEVQAAIAQLRCANHQLKETPQHEYRYFDSNTLNPFAILKALPKKFELDLKIFPTLTSTNQKAKELALSKNSSLATVIISDQQTAGYGRYQRQFFSPKNTGIYLSILLHQTAQNFDPGLLTTATALAVTRTLEKSLHLHPTIKWVNDVLVDEKKVCGILTEGITDLKTQTLDQVVVGIGVNFLSAVSDFPSALRFRVGTLAPYVKRTQLSRNQFIATLLQEFFTLYETYTTASFMTEYRDHCNLIGKMVTLKLPQTTFEAKVIDINDHGALVLSNGQRLSSGEVIKVRPLNEAH